MIASVSLIKQLEDEGYTHLTTIPGRGVCGLHRFVFTSGLVYGLDETGYSGRYCYETIYEARVALQNWNGVNDPSGDWIKHKGEAGEWSNPNL